MFVRGYAGTVYPRLTFNSFILGAVALTCVVAVPMTAATIGLWLGTTNAGNGIVVGPVPPLSIE
jgi:hypothetical protein